MLHLQWRVIRCTRIAIVIDEVTLVAPPEIFHQGHGSMCRELRGGKKVFAFGTSSLKNMPLVLIKSWLGMHSHCITRPLWLSALPIVKVFICGIRICHFVSPSDSFENIFQDCVSVNLEFHCARFRGIFYPRMLGEPHLTQTFFLDFTKRKKTSMPLPGSNVCLRLACVNWAAPI